MVVSTKVVDGTGLYSYAPFESRRLEALLRLRPYCKTEDGWPVVISQVKDRKRNTALTTGNLLCKLTPLTNNLCTEAGRLPQRRHY